MKVTDYAPRSAPFDHYLVLQSQFGRDLCCAELGVDAGAHAEAMLRTGIIRQLYLVDPWGKNEQFQKGICKGRLDALGYHGYFTQHEMTAQEFVQRSSKGIYDGVYCDLPQDGPTAHDVVPFAWEMLKPGGLLGYRNYCDKWPDMKAEIDWFLGTVKHRAYVEAYANEIVIVKL